MTFDLRAWLAREVGVAAADDLHPVFDQALPDGEREVRYFVSGRGVVTLRLSRTYFDDVWRLEARWPDGEASIEVALDAEVLV